MPDLNDSNFCRKDQEGPQIAQVRDAVRDMHAALDLGQNTPTVLCKFAERIEEILDMPWSQGQELARRKSREQEQGNGR